MADKKTAKMKAEPKNTKLPKAGKDMKSVSKFQSQMKALAPKNK